MLRRIARIGLTLLLSSVVVLAQAAFPKPTGKFVNDFANILDANAEQSLEQRVRDIQQQTTAEIAIVTVPTLNKMPVEEYANRLFKAWGIGRAKEDNGVLLLLSTEDHDIKIEVGYGLEGVIPDGLAGEIIRTEMTPRFKKGDFAGGLQSAVARIGALVRAHHVLTPQEIKAIEHPPLDVTEIAVLIAFLSAIVSIGTFFVGVGVRTRTFFPIIFGGVFSGIALIIGLVVTFVVAMWTLVPIALAMFGFGYVKAAKLWWHNKVRSKGNKTWTMGGPEAGPPGGRSGSGSSGWSSGGGSSSSSSSGGSFGGGSSGGGGASGKW